MVRKPPEAPRQGLRADAVEVTGRLIPVEAPAAPGQNDGRLAVAAGEARAVDAVDDRLLPVRHGDRVAEHVHRAAAEELPGGQVDDADVRVEQAPVADPRRRRQFDREPVLGREAVMPGGRGVAEIVGRGDTVGERQDVVVPQGVRAHFRRHEQVTAPAGPFQPALAAQAVDRAVSSLGVGAEHVDDLPAVHGLRAARGHVENDAAFPGRERAGNGLHDRLPMKTPRTGVFC